MKKFVIAALFVLSFLGVAHAQGPQCRTSPVGTSTPSCASEAFVTESMAAGVISFNGRTGAVVSSGTDVPLRSYLAGLTLSTAGSSSTFGVAAGVATDSTNAAMMALASAYTKTTGAWAIGSGNGSFDGTGSAPSAHAGWYHVFLIERTDINVVDVLTSNSATSPTLPTNYTLFRRIGSMLTNGSFQWVKFLQNGDEFYWDVATQDVVNVSPTTSPTNYTVSTPLGIVCNALLTVQWSSNVITEALMYSPLQSAQTSGGVTQLITPVAGQFVGVQINMRTDTNSRVVVIASANNTNHLYINTQGWIDRRGRDN